MEHFEKTLSQNYRFQGRILRLRVDQVQLENGRLAEREVVEHPGGVCVLAIDDRDQVILVRQYRYPYRKILLEVPAGKLDPGEDPESCGRRELLEETGFTAGSFQPLGRLLPSPGYVDEVIHIYIAKNLVMERQKLDADEFLTVSFVPYDKALDQVLSGEIEDAKTQIALLKYAAQY